LTKIHKKKTTLRRKGGWKRRAERKGVRERNRSKEQAKGGKKRGGGSLPTKILLEGELCGRTSGVGSQGRKKKGAGRKGGRLSSGRAERR